MKCKSVTIIQHFREPKYERGENGQALQHIIGDGHDLEGHFYLVNLDLRPLYT